MKAMTAIGIALTAGVIATSQAGAQQSQHGAALCGLVNRSLDDPGTFDSVLSQNRNLFTPQFRQSMQGYFISITQQGQAYLDMCRATHPSGSLQLSQCIGGNMAIFWAAWLASVEQQLSGTAWGNTAFGAQQRQGIEACMALGWDRATCEGFRRSTIPMTMAMCRAAFN